MSIFKRRALATTLRLSALVIVGVAIGRLLFGCASDLQRARECKATCEAAGLAVDAFHPDGTTILYTECECEARR